MRIRVICIGKLKERYWSEAITEYSKRLSRFVNLEIVELKEARLPDKASAADEEKVKEEEGKSILAKIEDGTYVITLEIQGKQFSSEELAHKVEQLGLEGHSDIVFVIGGSLGLSQQVSKRADFKLSFSKMTFPHQMMRVVLLEQVYRSFKIIRHETYHK
ncbi:MAG: 23S rRNA (pseudouridine(1915)-N(3))-methyltransferase RlmH [Firmicutes bacterium]|jgi:23S rRNA (pseudouridine1915-N3)-methyltransferase|nr:23S rRNA (pseudouridine(1915)-N(3))-methyltransferase RlmH [Bacillota bacterium]